MCAFANLITVQLHACLLNRPALSWLADGMLLQTQVQQCLHHGTCVLLAGHLAAAVLDVFREEPLPQSSRLWAHPSIRITPHVASLTNRATAIQQIARNYQRFLAGQEMLHCVDTTAGY